MVNGQAVRGSKSFVSEEHLELWLDRAEELASHFGSQEMAQAFMNGLVDWYGNEIN